MTVYPLRVIAEGATTVSTPIAPQAHLVEIQVFDGLVDDPMALEDGAWAIGTTGGSSFRHGLDLRQGESYSRHGRCPGSYGWCKFIAYQDFLPFLSPPSMGRLPDMNRWPGGVRSKKRF